MAREPQTAGASGTRKRRAPTGPRKNKPLHFVYAVGADGAPDIRLATRDLEEAVDMVDGSNGELRRFKYTLPPKATAESGEASA